MKKNKRVIVVWSLLWFIAFALMINPYNKGTLRLGLIGTLILIWCGTVYLLWRNKILRNLILVLPLVLCIPFILPGRNINTDELRKAYIESLQSYEGTTYIWGGENRFGMDCSGLIRKGLICANFQYGLCSLDGGLLRQSGSMWLFDSSAMALRDEYRGLSKLLFKADSINTADHSQMLPGDFAVTSSGVHTLVYLGEKQWMQADPTRGKVVRDRVPVNDSSWFKTPVHLMRWRQFEK